MKKVEIIWRDIVSQNEWISQARLDRFITKSHDEVMQIGYLYEEDEDQVVLITNYFKGKDLYGTVHRIPRGCIVEIKYL